MAELENDMRPLLIKKNEAFVDRVVEMERLRSIGSSHEASIIVMYGRRRIGKTELLEQTFRDRKVLKFEGIEGLSEKEQRANVMAQFARYVENPILAKTVVDSWREFFELIAEYTKTGVWTIYLEELQWLANYKGSLISELKYVWDNYFRHNPDLVLILCGSAPSFMLDHVVHSKALYNRSQHEFNLRELNLLEVQEFLTGKSTREVLDAYLTIGGIPEYLKWVRKESSVFLSLCKHSFSAGSFFSREYERIFTSSMAKNAHYRGIINALSHKRFASRKELAKSLKLTSGGSLSQILTDLEKSGFIAHYPPYHLQAKSTLTRYAISDNYLQFYLKFIEPILQNIESGMYDKHPQQAIKSDQYMKWLGFAFERWCRKYHYVIAKILGFSGVQYRSGAFFSRSTEKDSPGFQIDLIFERADFVNTICEIKYLQGKVGTKVIDDFERKLALFPNKERHSLHKVLICPEGADTALINCGYFDQIITRDQLFKPGHW